MLNLKNKKGRRGTQLQIKAKQTTVKPNGETQKKGKTTKQHINEKHRSLPKIRRNRKIGDRVETKGKENTQKKEETKENPKAPKQEDPRNWGNRK